MKTIFYYNQIMTKRTFVQNPQYHAFADFSKKVPSIFQTEGTLIHNARNQIKVFTVNGQKVNVKKYCIPPILNRILYSLGWRTPKAKATYENAQKILAKGFLTPQPYGYILEKNGGLLDFSYFISEQIDGWETVGYRTHTDDFIKALARFTVDLHEKGLLHVDYTPNNILFTCQNGQYTFSLVDINRFHFYNGPIPVKNALENLMKPFHDDKQLEKFVRFYCEFRKANPNLYKKVLRRRHWRNAYDTFKDNLKKLPLSGVFINKPLGKQK